MGLAGHVARKRPKSTYSVWWENLKEIDSLKYLEEDGRIILK
jgi:hypothetical protein